MLSKIKLVSICLLVSSCGQNSANTSNQTDDASLEAQVSKQNEEIPVQAKLFEKQEDIEECSETNFRQLVYIIETKDFLYCSQTNEWVSIDLKGPKGDKGDVGDKGLDGKDGTNGKDGRNGTDGIAGTKGADGDDGIDGKDAPIILESTFIHPVNGKKWFLGRNYTIPGYVTTIPRTPLCPTGSRSPAVAEIQDAIFAGLYLRFEKILATVYNGLVLSVSTPEATIINTEDWGYVTLINRWGQLVTLDMNYGYQNTAYTICIID
jgi:hypothetical protein